MNNIKKVLDAKNINFTEHEDTIRIKFDNVCFCINESAVSHFVSATELDETKKKLKYLAPSTFIGIDFFKTETEKSLLVWSEKIKNKYLKSNMSVLSLEKQKQIEDSLEKTHSYLEIIKSVLIESGRCI